jgi:hypothetical protein
MPLRILFVSFGSEGDVNLHMQPALFRSVYDCPLFMERLAWLSRSPRWVKRVFFGLVDVVLWEAARKR